MCLAHGHNTVALARLELAAPRPRVKHYTTEQLRPYVEFVIERLQAGSRPAASVVLLSARCVKK